MKTLVLLLGTNLGERAENLKIALKSLTAFFGKIQLISSVYETEPWGYQSNNCYYNQAVTFDTDLSAYEVLHVCKSIEISMGRTKNYNSVYENRIIDIDILFLGNTAINDEVLKIPHPEIDNRNFVLVPLSEIIPNFVHPVSNISISDLLKQSKDKLRVENVSNIKQQSLLYKYITIEGCIGAGKTSLSTKISTDFDAKLILEQFEDNPFLPKFYKDQEKYAFPLELSFLASRYNQLNNQLTGYSFIVSDYFLNKSFIFAKNTLTDDLFKLYSSMFNIMITKIPAPNLLVYLYSDVDKLLSNIKKRNRVYEQNISPDYLFKIQKGYLDYFKQSSLSKVLIINTNDYDFVQNEKDYIRILNLINTKWDDGVHEV